MEETTGGLQKLQQAKHEAKRRKTPEDAGKKGGEKVGGRIEYGQKNAKACALAQVLPDCSGKRP